ncbi:MAG: hypothetical protein SGCHY_002178, partial [Lobulomycetales sp.]
AYLARRQAIAADTLPPSPDFHFKKGSQGLRQWEAAASTKGPVVRIPALQMAELDAIEPRSLAPDAAPSDLLRHPHEQLYLLTRSPGSGWQLPSTALMDGELLHEAAERLLASLGKNWQTWVVGKVPAAHTSAPAASNSDIQDTFIIKARLLAGFPDLLTDDSGSPINDVQAGWFAPASGELEGKMDAHTVEKLKEIL